MSASSRPPTTPGAYAQLSPVSGEPAGSPETTLSDPEPRSVTDDDEIPLSLLDGSLGLDLDTHPEYIGPSHYREPALLDLARLEPTGPYTRRLNHRDVFLIHLDDKGQSDAQRQLDCDAVEACVAPLGAHLVKFYFDVVHHNYPVLHKGVFVAKHAISHRLFSPPLLAAVYLVAMEHPLYKTGTFDEASWVDAKELGGKRADLQVLAERTMAEDLKRPKLSTLQAGLLLQERSGVHAQASNRMFMGQLIGLAQGLGIHVDCEDWSIPQWEKSLRRRLAWALYSHDRWSALVHGRPLLLNDEDWTPQPCSPIDFIEVPHDQGVDLEESRDLVDEASGELVMRRTQLVQMLTQVTRLFYTAKATRPGGSLDQIGTQAAVEMAKPILLEMRNWHTGLSGRLSLEHIQQQGKLMATATLHVEYTSLEIALHRALLRLLTPATPKDLALAVRAAARKAAENAVQLAGSLRPEHTLTFWGGIAAYQLSSFASLICLLWATAENADEMAWCTTHMTNLRWALTIRTQGCPLIKEALFLLERDAKFLSMPMDRI